MKKVVLLAGVVAAGMAVAPVAANAAAPKSPEVLTSTNGDAPYQDYEHYYNVLAARHTALELMKQDVTNAVKAPYKDMSAASLTAILADIQDQINELDALQTRVKTLYDNFPDKKKSGENALSTSEQSKWDAAINEAIDYIENYVTADDFENLLDTYQAFDAQMKEWEAFDVWFNTDYDGEGPATVGYKQRVEDFQTTVYFTKVNETPDVATATTQVNAAKNAFDTYLTANKPVLDADKHSIKPADATTVKTNLGLLKSDLIVKEEGETAGLETIVLKYLNAQGTLENSTAEGVQSLKNATADYTAVDPLAAPFVTEDGKTSTYYTNAINTAQSEIAAKKKAAEDYISTFNASDPAAWMTGFNGEDGKAPKFSNEAGYEEGAKALLTALEEAVEAWKTLVQAAEDNVTAYNALVAAEKVSQGKMDEVYGKQTTATDDATAVSYFDRKKEDTFLDSNTNVLETVKYDHATDYVYRQLIQNLEKELCDETNDAYVTGTEDYLIHGTSTDDIHDQIIAHFNTPVSVGGVVEDASVYQTQMTLDNVIFGAFNNKVAALLQQIDENEAANKALHGTDWEKAIEKHIVDEMYNTCVGYDDVTADDFLGGGRFWSSADCEDGKHYRGYCSTWRVLYYTFIQQEVQAFNDLKAKEYLESETGAAAAKKAVDDNVELLWNHVATVQCQTYLDRVDAKMADTTTGAFYSALALDDVCKDPATVWDWTQKAAMLDCDCEANDTAENPCGWCAATPNGELAQIIDDYNEKVQTLDEKHKALEAKTLVGDFKTYEAAQDGVDGTIDTWLADFTAADEDHDQKLQDLKDEATQYVHEYIHEVVGDMSLALTNFEDGDLAAANLWAQNLENRTFPVYSTMGGEPTNEGLDLDLDGATDSYVGFEAYVDAVRAAEGIYTAKIKELFDLHKWTELRKIADRAKDVHPATDYQKAVDTNRTARIALEDLLAAKKAELEAAINTVDETKIYSTTTNPMADPTSPMYVPGAKNDFTALTDATVTEDTDYKAALKALADEATAIENAYNDGKAGDWYQGGVEDANKQKGYEFKGEDIAAAIDAYVAAIAAAEKLYRENAAALAKFQEELKTVAATKLGIDGVLENADVYDVITPDATDDADTVLSKTGIVAAAETAYSNLFTTETADTHLPLEFAKGELKAHEAIHDGHILALTAAVKAYEEAVLKAINFKAKNVADYNELMDLFNNAATDLKLFVDELALTDEIYDVDGHKDLTAIKKALADLQSNTDAAEIDFAQVQAALEAALANGTVTATKADLEDQIGQLSEGVSDLRTELKGYVDFYKAEHALAADFEEQLANLEILFKSIVPGDIYVDRTESEDQDPSAQDMKVIKTLVEEIYKDVEGVKTGLIPTEAAAIDADLDAAKVQANKTAHETALANIETKIKELQKAVVDFEQFKADNQATRDALVNDLTNLLVVAEGLKNYGDVYGEDAEGYDAETIDRAIKDLENSINGDLSFLNGIDYPAGDLLLNEEQYRNSIDVVYAQDIQNIKDIIAGAEQLYAMNLRALNNLEEHIKAVETILHTTKAMCACNECNVEDQAEVDALLTTLDGILDDVNTAFSDTKDLWQQEGAFNGQVEDVEADAANLLALIQLHLDRVQNDLRVYNTLQTLLVSVDAEMLNLEAEEGYQHFANRDAYHDDTYNPERPHFHETGVSVGTNPNVKYGNELAQMVEDLKAEIERQHSHEGGHSCEENKIADVKAMNDIKAEIEKTIAAIKANEAAHELLKDRFNELFEDAKDAYEFWNKYYSTATLITHEYDIAQWIKEWNGVLENGDALANLENLLHDYYVHGNAANAWTVDGKGEELNGAANDKFAEYDEALANDRNEFAHTEALNHLAQVVEFLDTYKNSIYGTYTKDGLDDPFVKDILVDWREDVEGEYGLYASLNLFRGDIQAAYEEGVMEDAINIDNHNTALGIHQQLDGVLGVLSQIDAEYAALFEAAHHLTNGKTVYSDQEYFTLGFFREANDGYGFQGQEMFTKVVVNDIDLINVLDLTAYEFEVTYDDPTDLSTAHETWATDEDGNLIRENNGYATDVQVLVNGNKQNELTFNIPQHMAPLAVTTLLAGPADIEFLPGSITVVADEYGNEWTTKHNVYIGFNVAEPVVEDNQDVDAVASSNKLIVRVANPVDLTYTSKVLVATTNTGDQFSFADATFNTAKGQIEFDLPEGTESVVLPEGFFTFRTGENTIARSAACTIAVAGATSIEGLIAMGEKAQIFDLQGRRVKAEALISGNTYVVNGEKVMVK